ncbi:carboxypeptidase-like regulatory domain-containing protein [Chitinophaga sancti]|uniref:carboxypeptidase-like regulatory domain-containing protein n=1 Tax=Chitinophaga sancti TaxID=1004 RepID=UPI003F78D07A
MSLLGRMLLGILLIPLQVLGWDWHTRITVTVNNQPLSVICGQLESQYGIHFSYSREIVDLSRRVTVNFQDKPLKRALDELFSPFDIRFARIGEQIVLTVKKYPNITISGYIQDVRNGERLIGATIYSPSQQVGATTNQFGFFSLTIPKDTASLCVSYIGYHSQRLCMTGKSFVIVGLQPSNSLREFTVSDTAQGQRQMSALHVSPADVKSMPRLLGESDVMRAIATLPGISGGVDGGTVTSVRGGGSDQNLILLDGSPVFNSSHLFGLFSVFNPDIVKSADFYKGGFPARYAGRLSSVIDISTKDGDMKEYHGEASAGVIAVRGMVEGPIKKDKTSFVVSARRSILEPILNNIDEEIQKQKGTKVNLVFHDVNLKINHIFSPKDRLYFSSYVGNDNLGLTLQNNADSTTAANPFNESTVTRLNWGNHTFALRWNHVFNPKLFVNTTLNYSQYYFNIDYNYYYQPSKSRDSIHLYGKYYSMVKDLMLRTDAEFIPDPNHIFKFGAGGIIHKFNPGVSAFEDYSQSKTLLDTAYNQATSVGGEVLMYAEDDWTVTDALRVNMGLHGSGFLVKGKLFYSLQPRVQVRYQLPNRWTLMAGFTHMNQYLHVLSESNASLPMDLWVPSTKKVGPMFSRQFTFGVNKILKDQRYSLSVEAYYKSMRNVIEYKDNSKIFNSASKNWDDHVETGTGTSYGGEVMLEKRKGKLRGWIGYTLSWAYRRFPNVNGGERYPYNYDGRHDIKVMLMQQVGKRWELAANWHFNSGLPLTLPVASYEGVNNPSPYDGGGSFPVLDQLSNRNQYRSSVVHRLDLSATNTKEKSWGSRSWTISLFNAYNHANPFLYSIVTDKQNQKRYLQEISILPILPSVTFSIKF